MRGYVAFRLVPFAVETCGDMLTKTQKQIGHHATAPLRILVGAGSWLCAVAVLVHHVGIDSDSAGAAAVVHLCVGSTGPVVGGQDKS